MYACSLELQCTYRLTPGGNMVKLRKIAQSLLLGDRVLNFLMALSGVKASLTAIVRL